MITRVLHACYRQQINRLYVLSERTKFPSATNILCFYTRRGFKTRRIGDGISETSVSRIGVGLVFATGGISLLGLGKKEEEDPVVSLFREARLAQYKKDFEKAEKLFHDALRVADDKYKKKMMSQNDYLHAKTNIYDSLADMALARGQFEKAEKLYKETMKCCLEIGVDKEDNSVIEISIKLASIYAMMQKDNDAKIGFKFCIEAQEKKIKEKFDSDKDTLALLGLALESYGRYLMYHKQLEEAQPLFERAVEVATTSLGEEHPQTLILHNDLATLNILKKNYKPAEIILKKAIEIGERIESSEVPALYCNLGAVYLRRSQVEDAERACHHAQELAQKLKDKITLAQSEKCLSKVEQARKRGKKIMKA